MNTAKLRSKRVIIATTAAVAALAVGGGVWATAANADTADVTGADRDRVGNAAVQAVGGGTILDVEKSDDDEDDDDAVAGAAYEAEVRKADGTEVDVLLDKDLKVIGQQADTPDTPDAGERVPTDAERKSAEAAAVAAVGAGSTVTDVDPSGADGTGYDVEVRAADNTEWDVELDAAFKVLTKTQDQNG